MRPPTKLFHILFLALTFIFLAAWSWKKTANFQVDFGLQLYLPWQLASGKLLYRDVAYLPGGPFSSYFNAALFKLFGTSVTTLLVANLAIIVLMISILFRFFQKISDSFCATAICFAVLSMFAFSELEPGGNYNYASPYSHDALHALVLSIFAVFLFSRWILNKSSASIFFAGICVGLVFLTKPEIFLAIFVTAIVAFILQKLQNREELPSVKPIALFFVAIALLPLISFFYFYQFQSSSEAWRATAWAWVPLLTSAAAKNQYYIWCMGLDHPLGNTFIALMQLISVSIAIALCAWCSRSGPRNFRHHILGALILVILAFALWRANWRETGRVLMFLTPAISGFLVWNWWKLDRRNPHLIPAILWSVFAVMMLLKLGFFSRFWHYGPFLAMPATVLAAYFIFGFLPGHLTKWNVRPTVLLTIFSLLLGITAAKFWYLSNESYSMKTAIAGKGADKLFIFEKQPDQIGGYMNEALEWMEQNTAPQTTLAVVPQGVILNYLLRRENPTPFTTLVLPEWQAFGEAKILAAYKNHPPDHIMLVHQDSFEYGMEYFGKTDIYGLKTMQWINENYAPVHLIGREPLSSGRLGVKILARKNTEQTEALSSPHATTVSD